MGILKNFKDILKNFQGRKEWHGSGIVYKM